ncbi:YveK family protein [Enterococcus phoeniculicola]|uniref:Capsular polysaccharide biosynthesis protein CpsC n=1 Tax=Enterococcus phoeniculicola ATCC BAA-412 TaxID=1158610 RepID=R3TPL1_9ENTE|nr:hypothetical protein [Enterococcus phoeniculicola]EOL42983.1 hypothetical protein UC3_01960 [Enterococcus phoeniculicola ATCC BAA-412]EOT76659.1 hypothetical protein I589_01616 [Enterococcus phoeniculicola ATCC BAA-412]
MRKTNGKLILLSLKKFWSLILLLTIISSFGATQIYKHFITQNYFAINQLLVTPKENEQFDLKYINTYKELLSGDVILTKVVRELKAKDIYLSVSEIQKLVAINLSNDSQLISVQVISGDKAESIDIANTIGRVAEKEIPKMLDSNSIMLINQTNQAAKINKISNTQFLIFSLTISVVIITLCLIYKSLFSKRVFFKEQIPEFVDVIHVYTIDTRKKRETKKRKMEKGNKLTDE